MPSPRRIPPEHAAFLEDLPYFVRIGGYLFVHAGFRPGMPVAQQHRDDMLWIREEFLSVRGEFGGIVVYGHTPSPTPVIKDNRIGIDTGAYATGKLTLAVFEGDVRRFHAVSAKGVRSLGLTRSCSECQLFYTRSGPHQRKNPGNVRLARLMHRALWVMDEVSSS